ncbi:MAG: aconitase family protein, partial [Nitrososphaerales archaeon]
MFPVDEQTLQYLKLTGRPDSHIEFVKKYLEAQKIFGVPKLGDIDYSEVIEIDLSKIEPSVSGPALPHDRVGLAGLPDHFLTATQIKRDEKKSTNLEMGGKEYTLTDGDVVIAAITSCTNTSNPSVMMAAGLLAKRAVEKGLSVKETVKTSLAPGSMVVTEYLRSTGLLPYLQKLGFDVVGYGCTTCIGNSGPLPEPVSKAIREGGLNVAAVLSGNRNFEARIHQEVRANFLMSPPLVVAFAIAGSMLKDLTREPLGMGKDGETVFLREIWPSQKEIQDYSTRISTQMFKSKYGEVYDQNSEWNRLDAPSGVTYDWNPDSTYIQRPPYFDDYEERKLDATKDQDILGAKALLLLGDYVTTDHISPAGAINSKSSAGKFLISKGVSEPEFNSYG